MLVLIECLTEQYVEKRWIIFICFKLIWWIFEDFAWLIKDLCRWKFCQWAFSCWILFNCGIRNFHPKVGNFTRKVKRSWMELANLVFICSWWENLWISCIWFMVMFNINHSKLLGELVVLAQFLILSKLLQIQEKSASVNLISFTIYNHREGATWSIHDA